MTLYRQAGTSFALPPLTKTTENFCKLWPWPGILAVNILPPLTLTLTIFRSAELGFLGDVILTTTQTPFIYGRFLNKGVPL